MRSRRFFPSNDKSSIFLLAITRVTKLTTKREKTRVTLNNKLGSLESSCYSTATKDWGTRLSLQTRTPSSSPHGYFCHLECDRLINSSPKNKNWKLQFLIFNFLLNSRNRRWHKTVTTFFQRITKCNRVFGFVLKIENKIRGVCYIF